MSEDKKEPLTQAGLMAYKLAVEAEADVIGEQCNEDGGSLKTVMQLLCYEIAASHVVQQRAVAKLRDFFDFAQPEPTDAGPHATGWRCTVEGARIGNLALRAQDRMIRGALALQAALGADWQGQWRRRLDLGAAGLARCLPGDDAGEPRQGQRRAEG